MKKIFIIGCIVLSGSIAYTQSCGTGKKIQSPIVNKPTDAFTGNNNCTGVQLQWKGITGQQYELNIKIISATTGIAANSIIKNDFKTDSKSFYHAYINANPGDKISWNVTAVADVEGRSFYSYPLRSGKEYIVPPCNTPAVTANSAAKKTNAALKSNEKIQAKIFPNPVHTILNINMGNTTAAKKMISIYDVYGRTVITNTSMQNNMQVDVRKLSSGTYFIKIEDSDGKILMNAQFIKE